MSSRKSTRKRRGSQETLPDWMWGIGLGVVALVVVGGFILVTNATGGGGSACDQALSPLGTSEINAEAFQQQDEALGRVIDFLNQGDIQAAESAFYGPVHNFTHNVDPPVREQDEDLAKDLCEAVIDLEEALPLRPNPFELSVKVQTVRELLRDAAVALGYPRPGTGG